MKVGLFIPCYIEQLYPSVGLATVEVLERHGVEVEYPEGQTCCGQPMLNSGAGDAARPLVERFLRIFGTYDHVVCPSGSCVSMVRTHYRGLVAEGARAAHAERIAQLGHLEKSTYELCEFSMSAVFDGPEMNKP